MSNLSRYEQWSYDQSLVNITVQSQNRTATMMSTTQQALVSPSSLLLEQLTIRHVQGQQACPVQTQTCLA